MTEPDRAPSRPNAESRANVTPLAALDGSGEFVTVEAWVNHLIDLDTHLFTQKGLLGDDSTKGTGQIAPRYFVIDRESDLSGLDKGTKYRFENVKDHYYAQRDQIQVYVTPFSRVRALTR